MRVAVLGTGIMGAPIARSLLRAGHEVSVWNRSAHRSAPLADDGARVAETPGAAGCGTRFKLVMNAWVLILNSGIAETLTLARGLGFLPEQVLEAIAGGP